MTDSDRRFAVVAAAGTFAVAVLLGLLGGLVHLGSGHSPLAFAASGTGAVVSYWLVTAGIALLGALTVVLTGFAVARSEEPLWNRRIALLGAAFVAGFPALLLFAVFVFGLSNAPGGRYTIPVLLVLLLPSLAVGAWVGRRRGNSLPWTPGLHAVLAAAFLTGLAVGAVAAPPVENATVETGLAHPPQVAFDAEYDPAGNDTGVLTVTHSGGDVVAADQLVVRIDGAANVTNATQTRSGPWAGGVVTNDDGERLVRTGHLVRVGVVRSCTVEFRYVEGNDQAVLAAFDCSEIRDES